MGEDGMSRLAHALHSVVVVAASHIAVVVRASVTAAPVS